jgi:hypothetical protein
MLTKQELYDILKDDGAKLNRAVNFISREELVEIYKERFGVDPDANSNEAQNHEQNTAQQNNNPEEPQKVVSLLKFDESGWCTALNKAYSRGLYRPASYEEYLALKKYAAEEIEA